MNDNDNDNDNLEIPPLFLMEESLSYGRMFMMNIALFVMNIEHLLVEM